MNKGQALTGNEDNDFEEAMYELKKSLAGLVLSLYPVTGVRAQELARTLPRTEGQSVNIEDIAVDLDKVVRDLFKQAGISKDFKRWDSER